MGKKIMRTSHDMYTGAVIVYPTASSFRKYDFHFTKKGRWIYLNSFDDPDMEEVKLQCKNAVTHGEIWRIVKAQSGEIFKEGGGF